MERIVSFPALRSNTKQGGCGTAPPHKGESGLSHVWKKWPNFAADGLFFCHRKQTPLP
jgi:hypothetical protein